MKKTMGILLSIFTVSFFLVTSTAFAEVTNTPTKRIVVKLKNDNDKSSMQFNSDQVIEKQKHLNVIEVPEQDSANVIESLKQDQNVEFVEEEIKFEYFGTVNDFYYDLQKKDFSYIYAPQAWDLFKPKKTPVVAVLDSGIDGTNPDLSNQIYKPYNAVQPGRPLTDSVGHGTHVAGIVGAQTNNGTGISSLSKGVRIMPIKVGDENYIGSADIAEGIYYAADNGASIINMSIGSYSPSAVVEEAINYAYSKGVLVIAAAGNDGVNYKSYPAAYNNVLSVAAVDSTTGQLADFSNYGSWVSIAAPGVNIFSSYPSAIDSTSPKGYEYMSGTSMASPMVASLAALLENQDPSLTHNQNRWIMEATSEDYNGSGYHSNGKINALNSLDLYNNYTRIFGSTSVATSNSIAELGWPDGTTTQSLTPKESTLNPNVLKQQGTFAILASNQSFPDSLSSAALAYGIDAPILLTYPNRLEQSTIQNLRELKVSNVLVLGGAGAVSDSVLNGLRSNGFTVNRIMGDDRFKTAVQVNNYVAKKGGKVIVANGRNFPDALSVSAFSASKQIPIVFVEQNQIPKATKDFLNKYQFSQTIVVGGTAAISDQVKQQLPNPTRISGADRFETNTKVINFFLGTSAVDGYLFATGRNFPDALAGGPFAAKLGYPLVLTDTASLPQKTYQYLSNKVNTSEEFYDMTFLGGSAAVDPTVIWSVDRLFYGDWYNQEYSGLTQYQSAKQEMNTRFSKK